MEVSGERVTGGAAAGDRNAHPKWELNSGDGNFGDYEPMFRAFMDKLLNNQGSLKVDGSLLFEFVPKAYMRSERLIAPETSFYFHRMEEGVVYQDDAVREPRSRRLKKSPAFEGYNYQKNVPPLELAFAGGGAPSA